MERVPRQGRVWQRERLLQRLSRAAKDFPLTITWLPLPPQNDALCPTPCARARVCVCVTMAGGGPRYENLYQSTLLTLSSGSDGLWRTATQSSS